VVETALIAWLPITGGLFIVFRPHIATATSLIFGVALLPSLRAIGMPVMPDLTQYTVPVIGCTVMAAAMHGQKLTAARPGRGPEALIGLMIFGALVTNLTNMDPQVFGPNVLPGLSPMDTVNDGLKMLTDWALPFYLGRALVRTKEEGIDVLGVLAMAGLFYVPFVLVELQTGPLFHTLVYGAQPSPSTFWHSLKYGGYRPNVLMNHGLVLSAFMLYCTLAWVGLTRIRQKPFGLPPGTISWLMAVVVVFCKSRAVWFYGLGTIPLLLLARARHALLLATILSAVILGYPFLRSLDLLPIEEIAEIAGEYGGADAASSLTQRTDTEDEILARTAERYFFGWGGYSRYWVYDPYTGAPLSVMDGMWVVIFGTGGLFRFLTLFSFLLLPPVYAWRRCRRIRSPVAQTVVATMSSIVVLRVFDMLPNSSVDPYLTFLGGALFGISQYESRRPAASPPKKGPKAPPRPDDPPSPSSGGASLAAGLATGPDRRRRHA